MAKEVMKQIIISILTCIAIVLIAALIFYQYIPSNKVIPAKVQAYSTPESIKTEIEDKVEEELKAQNELYEITDADLDSYKRTKSYNPGKSDPFAPDTTEDESTSSSNPNSKNASAPATEKTDKTEDKTESKTVDRNTTDNYYTAENISSGAK